MALPEYLTTAISVAGLPALVLIVLCFGPDAVLRLTAGLVAIVTNDEKRGQRCLDVLRALRPRGKPRDK
jgi:hypothetical protein